MTNDEAGHEDASADPLHGFRRLLIAPEVAEDDCVRSLTEAFDRAGLPVRVCPQHDPQLDPWSSRAATLVVSTRPAFGWVQKAEHGTLAVRPGEHYVHLAAGCRSACTYCYLRATEHGRRPLWLHVRTGEAVRAIEECVRPGTGTGTEYLFATGELADSLAESDLFPGPRDLVARFAAGDLGRLELRTKSDRIAGLLDVRHGGRTTVAFSLAPQSHIDCYEPGTADLERRLQAAARAAHAGYPIAFKYEPVVLDPGWPEAYKSMLAQSVAAVGAASIDHVSFGCLRWSQNLADTKIFQVRHHSALEDGAWIDYRPGRSNGTVARQSRYDAYSRLRVMLRRTGFNGPIWWSLEEPALVGMLGETLRL